MRHAIKGFAAFLVGLAIVLSHPAAGAADSKQNKELTSSSDCGQAESDYKSLRQKDAAVNDLRVWEITAAKLRGCLLSSKDDASEFKEMLLLLGELYEKTFRERNYLSGKRRAIYFYSEFLRKFPADERAVRIKKSLTKLFEGILPVEFATIDQPKAPPPPSTEPEPTHPQNTEISLPLPKLMPGKAVVVIDPGHGGDELGAWNPDRVYEKTVVLHIALELRELIKKRLGINAVLTRTDDIDVPLAARTKFANDLNADLFISIHANASPTRTARGIETYYLNNTNDRASLKLAERENMAAGPVDDLSFMISDLIQTAKLDRSISLAHYIQSALYTKISAKYADTKNLGVKKGPFFVLVGAHMPCALTEVSFIDNPVEGRRLASSQYQTLVAEALFNGIKKFFAK